MSTQSEEAAAELRKLHQMEAENIRQYKVIVALSDQVKNLLGQRDELLEALRWYVEYDDGNVADLRNWYWIKGRARALAAIAKAEGNEP